MRFCIFCGVEIPGDARYCQICGKEQPKDTQVEVDAAKEGEEADEEKPTGLAAVFDTPQKMIAAGVGAFLVALLLCTGLMMLLLK